MAKERDDADAAVRMICAAHGDDEGPLIPILHDIQASIGYVSDTAIDTVADELNLSRAEVFGVVTFYHDFHRAPHATHTLKVCRAEACQAVGGRDVWAAATEAAANGSGEVGVEAVYCLGNCACAPSVQLDGRTLGRMDAERVSALVAADSGAPS
ncbi:NAD(P)H-dependent oxidoreductase subunit E [Salinisphaera sp. LB1]|uniref:NAD(P)H-dependent oxidoreductase subunit E n=1 Tax=Salinisphaera sp. LB1 TaxID=2183911 RepID=UPI000D705F5D|nr:NAD(P)H-dependent oxidoreductase subunit E [Salinisphaera sp. LB1]AWN15915.1 NAD-dependent formate dehydrogenase gamma subunit [Salinisphaera sp. LB1]